MLVLSREIGQSFVLRVPPGATPTELRVVLVDIRSGQKARIGFDVPRDVIVDRLEVHEAKLRTTACGCLHRLGPDLAVLQQAGATRWKCPACATQWAIGGNVPQPTLEAAP